MKKMISAYAIALMFCSPIVFAETYVKIEGEKGFSKITKCPDGACVVNNIKAGSYVISFYEQRESGDASLGRENTIDPLQFQASVMSPRDASSGLATGRRQYKPLLIRKDGQNATGQIIVTDDGSTINFIGIKSTTVSSAAPVMQKARSENN